MATPRTEDCWAAMRVGIVRKRASFMVSFVGLSLSCNTVLCDGVSWCSGVVRN